jgi:hypothetical protein
MNKLEELKKIKKVIDELNGDEQNEIFKIIREHNSNYTLNNNGVFINMNNLSETTIAEINKFLSYSNDNKELEKERIEEVKNYIIHR